jgi:hypothetical protein
MGFDVDISRSVLKHYWDVTKAIERLLETGGLLPPECQVEDVTVDNVSNKGIQLLNLVAKFLKTFQVPLPLTTFRTQRSHNWPSPIASYNTLLIYAQRQLFLCYILIGNRSGRYGTLIRSDTIMTGRGISSLFGHDCILYFDLDLSHNPIPNRILRET